MLQVSLSQNAELPTHRAAGIRDRIYTRIATEIVKNLDIVAKEKPILQGDPNDIYYWALHFPGTGLLEETPTDFVYEELKRKHRLGLI